MSFTADVTAELSALPVGKSCCGKALLWGLFYGGELLPGKDGVRAEFRSESTAQLAERLLESRFHVGAEVRRSVRAGREVFRLECRCPALFQILKRLDSEEETPLWELLDFRCGNCRAEFLRGVFLSSATINDPHKGYHLEIFVALPIRARRLSELIEPVFGKAGHAVRGSREGLYYKSNGAISDFLYYIGASRSSFQFANICIERDIRNQENRATNCVARNISRSVSASQRQIAAVEQLKCSGRLDALSEELQQTARLRLENDSASLAELAALHNPPISKSGLNQRLNKLLREAEEAEK